MKLAAHSRAIVHTNSLGKKMIAAQFIKAVHIKRDYEIEIEFNVAFSEFQKIYLEPEPEESKRKRSATTILALAETAGQAV